MAPETDHVVLTFAELAFLTGASSNQEQLGTMLRFATYDDPSAVCDAGLASLQARRLARTDGVVVELSTETDVVAALLDGCRDWLELVHVHDDIPTSMFIGSSAHDHEAGLLITAESPGVFRCYALDPEVTPSGRVVSIVRTLAGADGDNAIYAVRTSDPARRFLVACDGAGNWRFRSGDGSPVEVTAEQVPELMESTLFMGAADT